MCVNFNLKVCRYSILLRVKTYLIYIIFHIFTYLTMPFKSKEAQLKYLAEYRKKIMRNYYNDANVVSYVRVELFVRGIH